MTAILTESGRTGIATSMKEQETYLAWGTGEESWGTTPPEDGLISSTSLVREIGRRICEDIEFCYADDNGEIITQAGRFSPSETPTNNLHYTIQFDFADGVDEYIREFGLFIKTELKDDVPIGQKYVLPTQLKSHGQLVVIERCAPIYRQAMTRELLNFVVTF